NDLAVGAHRTLVLGHTATHGPYTTRFRSLTVTVNGVNDAPTANPDTATTDEDHSVTANVVANDSDPDTTDTLTVSAASISSGLSSVSFSGADVTYNPVTAYNYLAVGEHAT